MKDVPFSSAVSKRGHNALPKCNTVQSVHVRLKTIFRDGFMSLMNSIFIYKRKKIFQVAPQVWCHQFLHCSCYSYIFACAFPIPLTSSKPYTPWKRMLSSYKLCANKKNNPSVQIYWSSLNVLGLFQVLLLLYSSPTFFLIIRVLIETLITLLSFSSHAYVVWLLLPFFILLCHLLSGRDWVLLAFKIAFRKRANCLESSRKMLHPFLTVIV